VAIHHDQEAFQADDQVVLHHLAEEEVEADIAEALLEVAHLLVDHDDNHQEAEEEDSKVLTSTLHDLSTKR
jgi:hypothetical protein